MSSRKANKHRQETQRKVTAASAKPPSSAAPAAVHAPTAPQLPPIESIAPFSADELVLLRSVVEVATLRGAWKGDELEDVGRCIKRVAEVLRRAQADGQKLVWFVAATEAKVDAEEVDASGDE